MSEKDKFFTDLCTGGDMGNVPFTREQLSYAIETLNRFKNRMDRFLHCIELFGPDVQTFDALNDDLDVCKNISTAIMRHLPPSDSHRDPEEIRLIQKLKSRL
jgi:hypothetical protein